MTDAYVRTTTAMGTVVTAHIVGRSEGAKRRDSAAMRALDWFDRVERTCSRFDPDSELSRLTQQMMRRATWKQLHDHVLVRVIARVYQVLGVKLTQRKLAQTVPFVGIGINAALSANMTRHTYQRAEDVYRLRFLSEKYGLDPHEWLRDFEPADEDVETAMDLPDVAEMLDEERQLEG